MAGDFSNPHFRTVETVADAGELVPFQPRVPGRTAGFDLQSIRVFVMDHRRREVTPAERSVELHYGGFVVSQSGPGLGEAERMALEVSYGADPVDAEIFGRSARVYELGPDPGPDDVDGRAPAIVTWHDDGVHFLIASAELGVDRLIDVAMSIYD